MDNPSNAPHTTSASQSTLAANLSNRRSRKRVIGVVGATDAAVAGGSAANTASHHGISTERRFFDQVKEVLIGTGFSRDSWLEFVRCLDLYAQGKLAKKDMFVLVQELFGYANEDLYEEFR